MRFEVFSLNRILKEVEGSPGCNLISIRDITYEGEFNEKYAALDRTAEMNGVNMLKLFFDDIDPYRFKYGMEHPLVVARIAERGNSPIFFDESMARDVVEWTMDIWKRDPSATVKVHCWAGRSRSQAMAYWLNMYFNLVIDRNLADFSASNALNVTEKVHFNCEVLKVFTREFSSQMLRMDGAL